MPKYLFKAKYSAEGVKGLLAEGGSARRAEAERVIASLGGTIEAYYYAFGRTDLYIICDLPDHVAAAAASLAVAATGAITDETVVLLAPEDVDEAARRQPSFRPPGDDA